MLGLRKPRLTPWVYSGADPRLAAFRFAFGVPLRLLWRSLSFVFYLAGALARLSRGLVGALFCCPLHLVTGLFGGSLGGMTGVLHIAFNALIRLVGRLRLGKGYAQ